MILGYINKDKMLEVVKSIEVDLKRCIENMREESNNFICMINTLYAVDNIASDNEKLTDVIDSFLFEYEYQINRNIFYCETFNFNVLTELCNEALMLLNKLNKEMIETLENALDNALDKTNKLH